MVCEKVNYHSIKIKNSAATIIGLVTALLLVMGMFYMGFSYLKTQTDAAGLDIPEKYSDTYTRLNTTQQTLNSNVRRIQANVGNISEATSVYSVAWNGMKGLGNTITLFTAFVSSSIEVTMASFISFDVVPPVLVVLATIGIIAAVVLLIVSALKGDPKIT